MSKISNSGIVIISGSFPPKVCGVGDYAERLYNEFKGQYSVSKLDISNVQWIFRILEIIYRKDTVIIQYPTKGYGFSILPQILYLILPNQVILNIHEYSQAKILRKIAVSLFFIRIRNRKIVFTTKYEKDYILKTFKRIEKISYVIPIGSNISMSKKPILKRYGSVGYFGLIQPGKGIEDFIKLSDSMGDEFEFTIIGAVPDGGEKYLEDIKKSAKKIKFELNHPSNIVADKISEIEYLYLPFPDGISERRASAQAGFINRTLLLTTYGEATTEELKRITIECNNFLEAKQFILAGKRSENILDLAEEYQARRKWSNVSREFKKIIEVI